MTKTNHSWTTLAHLKRTVTLCVAVMFSMNIYLSAANAEVKVRSYYKGSKTESSVGSKKGTSGSKKKNLKNNKEEERPGGRPPPDEDFEPGEVLISNPPRGFEVKVKKLGFSVIEHIKMDEIKMNIWRLKTPKVK